MRRWRRALRWAALVVVVGVLAYFVAGRRSEIAASLSHLSVGMFCWLVLLETVNGLLNGHRFYLIVREHGEKVRLLDALRLYQVGRLLNSFVPQVGNVYRGVHFKRLFAVGWARYAGVLAGFAWLSLVATLGLAAVVLLLGPPPPAGNDPLPAVLAIALLLLALPWVARALTALAAQLPVVAPLAARLHGLTAAVARSVVRPRLLVPFLLSTVLSFALWILYFGAAFRGIGVTVGVGPVAVMVCLVRLGSLLSVTPGNVGVLELASGALVAWLGFSPAEGVLAMALVRVVALVVNVGLAALLGGQDLVATLRAERRRRFTDG